MQPRSQNALHIVLAPRALRGENNFLCSGIHPPSIIGRNYHRPLSSPARVRKRVTLSITKNDRGIRDKVIVSCDRVKLRVSRCYQVQRRRGGDRSVCTVHPDLTAMESCHCCGFSELYRAHPILTPVPKVPPLSKHVDTFHAACSAFYGYAA